jgi:asparagine synthase (glutamine-hydrolysing)
MCGITGWVTRNGDLRGNRHVLEKMAACLAKRGPDAGDYFISKKALLGHRRLIVVDPEGGGQPMTRVWHGRSCTVVYNGELYNTEEIREELMERGYFFKSYSDTEVLLTAYMEWGPQCLKRFNGIYAFGIWDEERSRLFLARDPLGVKPLFYAIRDESLLFGSEIKSLLANPLVKPVVDERGIAEIFALGPARIPGSGVFKGIEELPPACCLTYDTEGVKRWEYWHLKAEEHKESLEDTAEHVRELLVDAVKGQLVADVPVCTFLSGGLDSSAISSIAARHIKYSGRLNTYAIDYEDNDKYFKADEYQPDSDGAWARRVSDYIGSCHHEVKLNNLELRDALSDAVLANDLPGMADVDSSLYLFCREVRKNATVAISGECSDEIFGGYPWFRRQEDINADTFPWSKAVNERKKLIAPDLRKTDIEGLVQQQYTDTLKKVPRLEGESSEAVRMRELYFLNIKWFMMTLLNRKDRMSMSNSLEVRVPFADYRLVEYLYNVPWEMKYCDNIEKGLLRKALKGLLPEDALYRRKSPYPKTHSPEYTEAVKATMRAILEDKSSRIHGLLDEKAVSQLVETGGESFKKPWYGQLMKGPQLIAYLIQLETWLREYNVTF